MSNNTLNEQVQQLQKTVTRLQDKLDIYEFINGYTVIHDEACNRDAPNVKDAQQRWQNLFSVDGVATYPFGSHEGREGKAQWAFGSVNYFATCQCLTSNILIEQLTDTEASVHSNIAAWWTTDLKDKAKHFSEGGYYKWKLRKLPEEGWKIASVYLEILWTAGEDPSGVGPKAAE